MANDLPRFDPDPSTEQMPGLACDRGRLPLRSVRVHADIIGASASVDVIQTFENPYDEAIEVSYVFPLPEMAAVTRCELVVDGRTIAARLRERGEAREAYAEAVEAGRRAALAEQDRQGVFTTTLGNLGPHERAEVRFAMAYPLPREDGRLAFRFPLVVGERYVPGTPIARPPVGGGTAADTRAVQDASRISPPRLAPGAERPALAIEVAIVHGELALGELEASLRATAATTAGTTLVRIAGDEPLDRDFVLRFRLGGDAVRTQLSLAPDDSGGAGTFQLVVVPPVSPVRTKPRDLVLLLDRSGSMDGWKLVAARRALARMLEGLDTEDRFAVYAFGSETIACADLDIDRLHVATARARARATEFVNGLSAAGGTEMVQPLELATGLLASDDAKRERWLVLVTDGQVANEDELVAIVARAEGVKVLALGIDDAVNAALLGRLSRASGGRVELVQDRDSLEDALDRLHLLLATPALERVVVTGTGGLELVPGTLVPQGPLHAFPGVPMVVRGRYRGAGNLRVRASRSREPFEIAVAGQHQGDAVLRACWAREQLLALEDRLVANPGDRSAAYDQIVKTSLEFGVLCRFTAFVAIDDELPNFAIADRSIQQPVEPTKHQPPTIAPHAAFPVTRFGERKVELGPKTRSGIIRGKCAYFSPEQSRGLRLDRRHEVHALGVMLWELVMGERLWPYGNDFETLQAIVSSEPRPLLPQLAMLEPVIRRALAKDPDERYDSPLAFAHALEALPGSFSSLEQISTWISGVAAARSREVELLEEKVKRAIVPAGGYAIVARIELTEDSDVCLAARGTPAGNEAIVLRRAREHLVGEPRVLESFLTEATLAIPGFVRTYEVGTDQLGGVFQAQEFVRGCSLGELMRIQCREGVRTPVAVALGVIVMAARLLDAALTLEDPSGAEVGVLLREMSPTSLMIGFDGRPMWTSLGPAPSPHFTAPRRTDVPLRVAPGVLDPTAAPTIHPAVGRWVVVPRGQRVASAPMGRVASWFRRAGEFWRPR